MRRVRGFTLTEVVSATMILMLVIGGTVALMISSSQGLANSVAANKTTNFNAQGMRWMSETLRSAMSVTINDTGQRIDYVLPKMTTTADAATGEKELVDPLVSDGVTRFFTVSALNSTVIDGVTNKVICRGVNSKDMEPNSSQYNKVYNVFQLTTIGSAKAVTITIVTREQVGTQFKYSRLKTTALLRNYK